jgi:hypothetical protein
LLVALFAAAPALAGEAERHAQILERLAPQDRQAYLQQLVAQQARAAASLGADVTGPVLTGFNSATTLNVSKSSAPFKVFVKATDDLSGVTNMYFYATGPSGQTLYVSGSSGFPALSVGLNLGVGAFNRMMEPGTWQFNYGYGYDGAGNYTVYDQATLEALGNATFTVVNNGGYDLVKPLLTDGKIVTPTVSLSSFLPGTTRPPYASVKVNLSDAGNTALAGVKSVTLYFCKLAAPNPCFYPAGYFNATGQATAALNVGTEVTAAAVATGTYELKTIYIYDHAGNYSYLNGTLFGGTTDFSTLFTDGTSIRIKP